MKNETIFRLSALAVLLIGMSQAALADNKGCSNASLRGTFSQKDSGTIVAPAQLAGALAGVTIVTFDGNGGMAGSSMTSLNGNVFPGTFQGTYKVNSDCTGTYTTQNSGGLTIQAFFAIADSGNELNIVITNPGTVLLCTARRQFPIGDWRQ